MASEEDKALPLVNTDDDPDSHMINKMATVESEISEKEKEEIRLLYERAERKGPAISYFRRRRKPAQKQQRGLFEPNKKGKDEILYPPGREADLALNVQKLRSELIHLGLFDEEAPRRTRRDPFAAPSPFQQHSKGEAS
ncbi:uncharacterized protein LOC107629233 isoform X2 [Arachis ipaensis]|uniref:uncharacterized protein LOC107629233 isoform X2 n=1 Tax=Arachis ipaensis TaxID=130454 RepID=UPI0007AEEDF4|nr:uncharacterized protein LOC107629233 isoform X2 [Arachis ipaensis]XP_020973439.1 uncharacterized protein LOC107629233 isoform X2 [Arachis ipaensis]